MFRMIGPSDVIDLGPWQGDETLHLFEVRFENINVRLDGGAPFRGRRPLEIGGLYWFSCAGWVRRHPIENAFWSTSGNGVVNGSRGWRRNSGGNACATWLPLNTDYIDPSDFAMRIEGRPVSAADEDDATNIEFEVTYGIHLEGGLPETRESDGSVLTAVSHPFFNGHRMEMIVTAHSAVEDPQEVDLTMQASIRRTNGAGVSGWQNAYIWNWTTGRFDSLGQWWIDEDPDVLPFRDLDASDYVNNNGEIKVLITHENLLSRFTTPFISYIDRVQIEVTGDAD